MLQLSIILELCGAMSKIRKQYTQEQQCKSTQCSLHRDEVVQKESNVEQEGINGNKRAQLEDLSIVMIQNEWSMKSMKMVLSS